MARTIRSTITEILKSYSRFEPEHSWVSPGELYAEAQDDYGYAGTQERLLQRADELTSQGVIESRPRGRMQNNWYRFIQSPASEPHYMKQVRRVRPERVCSRSS